VLNAINQLHLMLAVKVKKKLYTFFHNNRGYVIIGQKNQYSAFINNNCFTNTTTLGSHILCTLFKLLSLVTVIIRTSLFVIETE